MRCNNTLSTLCEGATNQEEAIPVHVPACSGIHESSEGLSSKTNPEPRGNPPTACLGKPMSIKQKAEPLEN